MTVPAEPPVVVVTGASRGIGRACAEAFLARGATVVGCDKTPPAEPAPDDVRYTHVSCDVTQPDAVRGLVAGAVDAHGRLDVLVNNAGVHLDDHLIDDITVDQFRGLFETNVVSAFVAAQAALPHLRRTRGSIVNVASLVGLVGQEAAADYCTTKAALVGLTKALAIDEARHGVRVNCVCPGAILTPLAESLNPPERLRRIGGWGWLDRVGTPHEVADVVVFLGSGASSFVTGQEVVVAGGADLGYGLKAEAYYAAMGKSLDRGDA